MADVCLVNALVPPDVRGGAENYVLGTARALRDRGYDAVVVSTEPYDGRGSLTPERTDHEGLPTWRFYPLNAAHRSNGTGGNLLSKALWHQVDAVNPHAAWAVGRVLDREDPDVVHTNNLVGLSPAVGRAVSRHDAAHVHTLHDYSLVCPKGNLLAERTASGDGPEVCRDPPAPCRLLAAEKRAGLGTPDVVTGPSRHVVDVHRRHGFFDGVRTERLPLGVESVADEPPPVPDSPSVLFVGRQLRAKGLETLFEAARRLPDVTFHVCGEGPDAKRTERAAGTIDNLVYHGFAPASEVERLRANAGVAVVPSIWMENSPLAIYESFARGLPVVGSDVGGIPELVTPGETGALFEPGDVDDLVATVESLVFDREALSALRAGALDWARGHTVERHVERLVEEVYGSAVGGDPGY